LYRQQKVVVAAAKLSHIPAVWLPTGWQATMFKLTKQEQVVVAFLVGAILLGSVVREWRGRNQREDASAVTMEKRER